MAPHLVIESVGATEILVHNRERAARLVDVEPILIEGTKILYEQVRQWYDSEGNGSWPQLAEATVARKASQGLAEPEKPLFAEGNLYESVTSPSGPYSFRHPAPQGVIVGADWNEDGWQIPVVLSEGTDNSGRGNSTRIPPRPIWPAESSQEGQHIKEEIGLLLMRGPRR